MSRTLEPGVSLLTAAEIRVVRLCYVGSAGLQRAVLPGPSSQHITR
jgi:hypothetical protein